MFGKHTRPIQSGFEPIKKLVQVQVNELQESVSAKKKKKGGEGKGAYQSPLQDPQKWKLCALDFKKNPFKSTSSSANNTELTYKRKFNLELVLVYM